MPLGAISQEKVPDFSLLQPSIPIPDQNAPDAYWGNPALPEGCTGFSASYIASLDLRQYANPKYTYDKTLFIENVPDGSSCTLQDAFKSSGIYGVQLKGESESDAENHRRSYAEVQPFGQDWFDTVRGAAYQNQRPVAVGTTWLPAWEQFGATNTSGIMINLPTQWIGGHAWLVVGQKTINDQPFLIGLTWNSTNWGDGGLCYFSREVFNVTMKINGSQAMTNHPAEKGDLTIRINLLELLISLYHRLLALI